jgi:hypothetical protein
MRMQAKQRYKKKFSSIETDMKWRRRMELAESIGVSCSRTFLGTVVY